MPDKVRELGADEFMTKPVDFDLLFAALARLQPQGVTGP
jgi:DNA-binding response OmpR family regulator